MDPEDGIDNRHMSPTLPRLGTAAESEPGVSLAVVVDCTLSVTDREDGKDALSVTDQDDGYDTVSEINLDGGLS